ncbi:Pentatricopeptide repeat-containing protein [Thalictrum thalictroides]|uniref:Pentatricopeptide repeat-containing protein n=1 Tax=Thalictrum thalictroides TaxID=46969 RepID=A0A7J6V3W0_THATH|nr:Pentatricopeptide repeat-containing protein [Thalictrum thalictroides]
MFDEMIERDVVSWTTLISGLVTQGYYAEGLLVFRRMKDDELSIQPNVATMVSVMSACAHLGSLDHARELHASLEKMGWVEGYVSIRNSLIDAYSKCGSISCASRIFHEMHSYQRDTYSWTAMIAGLAMHGRGAEAITWFLQMKQAVGVVPDAVTFIAVLSACAHAGLVDEGIEIFESMEMDYGLVPELQHYGCLVDLFGRAGLLEYAYDFLETMPMEPNLAILGSLLSACRVHNNVNLGEILLEKINSSCNYGGGAHVLLSNMYASERQWCEVVHIRNGNEEGDNKNMKPPGQSWIEVKDTPDYCKWQDTPYGSCDLPTAEFCPVQQ